MKYRSKPVVIEAIQFTGLKSYNEMLLEWGEAFNAVADFNDLGDFHVRGCVIEIETLEGTHTASIDDWIIKGTIGEFYPCKPVVFAKKYEKAGAP